VLCAIATLLAETAAKPAARAIRANERHGRCGNSSTVVTVRSGDTILERMDFIVPPK
jgi:hypothetical protein